MAKDEPLFKRSQQALGSQKSGRFGAAVLNLTPTSGMEVSDALAAVAATEEPDPNIRARLRGALAADANGVQSIQVGDPVDCSCKAAVEVAVVSMRAEGELSTASPRSPLAYHRTSVRYVQPCNMTPNQAMRTDSPACPLFPTSPS